MKSAVNSMKELCTVTRSTGHVSHLSVCARCVFSNECVLYLSCECGSSLVSDLSFISLEHISRSTFIMGIIKVSSYDAWNDSEVMKECV